MTSKQFDYQPIRSRPRFCGILLPDRLYFGDARAGGW